MMLRPAQLMNLVTVFYLHMRDAGSTLKISFDKGVSDDAAKNMAEMLTGMQYDGNSIILNKK